MQLLPTGRTIDAKNGCSRGNQQWWVYCTYREWCPESLVVPMRFGVRDGQKHLPDLYTPAITSGYPRTTDRQEEK
jgi:hypothetical protein